MRTSKRKIEKKTGETDCTVLGHGHLSLVPATTQRKGVLSFRFLLSHQASGVTSELGEKVQSVSWSLAEFRRNKIVQSPHENYVNVCRQHKEK